MIYQALAKRAAAFSSRVLFELPDAATWRAELPERRRRWREMLGLDPLPERTELHATVTGLLERDDYVVEKLHYQALPGCRIPANLYLPREREGKLPAVIYVCGHSPRAKFAYQQHARWFARHGYACMILDTIWAGECRGLHHGIYHHDRWDWYSRGYTPAGVEVWAAMRAMDYLETRDEIDATRFGITGNSGGGSISWDTAAADERVKVAAPSCQSGNVQQHVCDRTVDHHCDCTFWTNIYGWDMADLAATIAPRPLLIAAQREDSLWHGYAYHDVYERASRVYRLLGAAENIELIEDGSVHGYTPRTRLGVFSWFEKHLRGLDRPATQDVDTADNSDADLAVFPGMKVPADDRMTEVDRFFIALPEPPTVSGQAQWREHQAKALARLRATTLRPTLAAVEGPAASVSAHGRGMQSGWRHRRYEFEVEPGLTVRMHVATPVPEAADVPGDDVSGQGVATVGGLARVLVAPLPAEARLGGALAAFGKGVSPASGTALVAVEVRGRGCTSIGPGLNWSLRRAYPLLGQTLPERQVHDLLVALRVLRAQLGVGDVALYGRGDDAVLAIYAALLDEAVTDVVLDEPVASHDDGGPEMLAVLKVGDLPHNLALAWPRAVTFVGEEPAGYAYTRSVYEACGSGEAVRVVPGLDAWARGEAVDGAVVG